MAGQDAPPPGCGKCSTNAGSLPPSTSPGQPGQRPRSCLTWQEGGGPGGDVDLLQVLQRLRVEEADGGAGGEGHPDAAARLHHVRHAHGLLLVRLKVLLQHRVGGVGAGPGLPSRWGPHRNQSRLEGNLRSPGVRVDKCLTGRGVLGHRACQFLWCKYFQRADLKPPARQH